MRAQSGDLRHAAFVCCSACCAGDLLDDAQCTSRTTSTHTKFNQRVEAM